MHLIERSNNQWKIKVKKETKLKPKSEAKKFCWLNYFNGQFSSFPIVNQRTEVKKSKRNGNFLVIFFFSNSSFIFYLQLFRYILPHFFRFRNVSIYEILAPRRFHLFAKK